MLQEGQRLKRQGVDVVIGIIETHGRAETVALVEGLEAVPRRKVEYRGVVLEELDLDALLARRPTIALVDELAHTNAPGSRHAKRYQDIEELLRAGINVISTLNVQHLESLYDMVERATGVKVKERVPDYVLGMADQIINVDLSAEDLRERLEAGKIYPQERIERALANFFTPENLPRLRELTLGRIAHRLDRRRQERARRAGAAAPSGSWSASARSPDAAAPTARSRSHRRSPRCAVVRGVPLRLRARSCTTWMPPSAASPTPSSWPRTSTAPMTFIARTSSAPLPPSFRSTASRVVTGRSQRPWVPALVRPIAARSPAAPGAARRCHRGGRVVRSEW